MRIDRGLSFPRRLHGELTGAPVLAGLGHEELAHLCNYLDRAVYPAESVVVRERDASRDMFFVLDGEARVRRGETDVGALGKGAHFGELALITGKPRSATVA